jgi:hypothetical protein
MDRPDRRLECEPGLECEMEAEVLAAIVESRWPNTKMDGDLQAHASQCPICADVAAVAGAVLNARRDLRAAAVVPDAGRVWWQAQLRARREAAVTAGRPITAAQLIAFGCAVGLLGACFGATSEWFQAGLKWVATRELIPSVTALLTEHFVIALTVTAAFLLIPAALYLAVRRD